MIIHNATQTARVQSDMLGRHFVECEFRIELLFNQINTLDSYALRAVWQLKLQAMCIIFNCHVDMLLY